MDCGRSKDACGNADERDRRTAVAQPQCGGSGDETEFAGLGLDTTSTAAWPASTSPTAEGVGRFLGSLGLLKAKQRSAYTVHADEAADVDSIWATVQMCAATRIGHGVRIIDDVGFDADGSGTLGRLLQLLRDSQIPLEFCPSSNVQTAARSASIGNDPFRRLDDLRFQDDR